VSELDACLLLDLVLNQDVLGWLAIWRYWRSSYWLSSPTQQQLSTSPTPIHFIGAPGYNDSFFLLEYIWLASSITKSSAYNWIPKPSEVCHLFHLVTLVQYHPYFCLVIMVVTANSGDDVGITLRVTNIMLPPTVQPETHEDCATIKVDQYVGSREGNSSEEGFLTNKVRRRQTRND
jgi:hypothetical protein